MRRAAAAIIQWEWVFLFLLLPLLFFPNSFYAITLLLIPLLWLARYLATGHFIPPTPYDAAVLALLLALLISLFAIFDPALSFPGIASLVFGVACFYGAVAYARRRASGLWHLVALFLLAGLAMTGLGLVGTPWIGPFAGLNRLRGLLPAQLGILLGSDRATNPNILAGILDWLVPLLAALLVGLARPLWQRRRLWPRLWLLVLGGSLLLASALLVATFSRGGMAAALLALLLMLAVMIAAAGQWRRWLLAAAVAVILALAVNLDLDRLNQILFGSVTGQFGLADRLEIWSRALYALADFPLTGTSMNGFVLVVARLYPLFRIAPGTPVNHAHNQLLQAGLDLGLLGLVAYLALWLVSAGLLWRCWRREHDPPRRALVLGLAGALLAGWLFGVFDAIGLGTRPAVLWWLLLAQVAAVHESSQGDSKWTNDW